MILCLIKTPFSDGLLEYEHEGGNTYVYSNDTKNFNRDTNIQQGGTESGGYIFQVEGTVTFDDTMVTTDVV